VFWGRLDFGPNIQGLEWFCRQVWPLVRQQRPDAQFTIIGFDPGLEVRSLATQPGISLLPDVENLADEVARHSVVALPFVSGGGIKNKLLEAAAMGKAIVSTPRGLLGLVGVAPVAEATGAQEFAAAIVRLCSDDAARRQAGADLREWVKRHHDWSTVATAALAGLGSGKTQDASIPAFSRVR
jgi:glycosyltransferase involved in cell wall biosynthesis